MESHFKNEGIYRFGPPPPYFDGPVNFFRNFFSLFPKEIRFPVGKKKKRRRRRRKKKWCQGAAGAEEKEKIYFFYLFFLRFFYFFLENNLAKFWKFWGFWTFFLQRFPLEKCLSVQSAFSAALMGWKILEKKKMDFGFEIFHIFYAKKRPFFFDFWTPLIFGPEARFFRHFTNFFAPEKIFRFGPPPFWWTCKFPHSWNVTPP